MGNERNIGRNWKNYDVLENVDKWIKVMKGNDGKWEEKKDEKGRVDKEIKVIK